MKTAIFFGIFAICFFSYIANAQSQKAKIELKYDEFRDVTTLILEEIKIKDSDGNKAELYFFIANAGDTLIKPETVSMGFAQTSDSWRYLNCTNMNFLLDTLRVNLGESRHTGSILGVSVLEQLSYRQPFSFLESLAKAKKVRFKICAAVFTIERENLERIKTYYNRIVVSPQ